MITLLSFVGSSLCTGVVIPPLELGGGQLPPQGAGSRGGDENHCPPPPRPRILGGGSRISQIFDTYIGLSEIIVWIVYPPEAENFHVFEVRNGIFLRKSIDLRCDFSKFSPAGLPPPNTYPLAWEGSGEIPPTPSDLGGDPPSPSDLGGGGGAPLTPY